jgi:hypothetical protein
MEAYRAATQIATDSRNRAQIDALIHLIAEFQEAGGNTPASAAIRSRAQAGDGETGLNDLIEILKEFRLDVTGVVAAPS